jgi:glycosyltransferase involved in cell wall biosynthesis
MKQGWLLHDKLTCIPGTKTLWHDLLEWLPGLVDMTNGGELGDLPAWYYNKVKSVSEDPTYWPWIDTGVPTISILQDIRSEQHLRELQIDVCNKSDIVLAVSEYVAKEYRNEVEKEIKILPIAVDFDLFKPIDNKKRSNKILWIGDVNDYPKGFDILKNIIKNTDHVFNIVLKSDNIIEHPRVNSYSRVPHSTLIDILNDSDIILCTSRDETLHLASIEAAAANIPIITSNVGAYYGRPSSKWGINVETLDYNDFIVSIDKVFANYTDYSPREVFINEFSKESLKDKWVNIVESLEL